MIPDLDRPMPTTKAAARKRLEALRAAQGQVENKLRGAESDLMDIVVDRSVEDVDQLFASAWRERKALAFSFLAMKRHPWPFAYAATHRFVFVSSQHTGGIENPNGPNAFFLSKAALGRAQDGFLALAEMPGRLFAVRWAGGKDPGALFTVDEGPGSFSAQMKGKDPTVTTLGVEVVTLATSMFTSWQEVGEDPRPAAKLPMAVLSLLTIQKLINAGAPVPLPDSHLPLFDAQTSSITETLQRAAREARVFQIPAETVRTVHRSIEKWVYAQRGMSGDEDDQIMGTDGPLIGLPQLVPAGVKEHDVEDGVSHVAFVANLASQVPFPEQLPFNVCWLGWDQPLLLGPIGCAWRGLRQRQQEQYWSLGMFVFNAPGAEGDPSRSFVVEAGIHPHGSDGRGASAEDLWCCTHRGLGRWGAAGALFPWLTSALVAIIEDCRTFVVESGKRSDKDYHRHLQAAQRKVGIPMHAPRPWYSVSLTDTKVIHAFLQRTERPWPVGEGERLKLVRLWSHRWDVGAHDRMYVRRGKLPILPKEREALRNRGYDVWTTDQPDDALILHEMHKRAHPLRHEGEWLAVRLIRIDQYQKGPEDAPYRPAVRHLKAKPVEV